ncbi:MAG: hypothetical protein JNM59_05270 [Hyphomonadaceae bacterium]|nr:hypothetical protein [Hyphomonadaceae bacterium]
MSSFISFFRRHALVRLFLANTLIGFGASGAFVGALLWVNAGGIATLIERQHAWPFVLLLWFFAGLTFASVQMGVAVMNLVDRDGGGGGKRQRTPLVQARAAATNASTLSSNR